MPRRQDDLISDLFHRALALPARERVEFVRSNCAATGAADGTATEILELLAADSEETQANLRSPISADAIELVPRIEPFRIVSEIGEGAMGRVYRAEQLEPVRRPVAIKVLKGTALTPAGRARFQSEQQVLARLQHRSIARVLDGGQLPDGRPYLVMDFVDGVPLNRWLEESHADIDTRLDLFHELCEAVQHAHGKGVIHRDLKPSNILIVDGSSGPEPRIIDFGIARTLDTAFGEETLHTGTDAMMGTAGYMSPEQAFDASNADARSDIYALGVILYELLTSRLPRDRASRHDPDAWTTVPERPTRRSDADLPADLDWVVLRALAIEPERRYRTALEFQTDVARARRHEPVTARPPTWTYVGQRFLRRHRVAATATATVLILLVTSLLVFVQLYNRADSNWQDYRRLVDDKRLQDLRAEARERIWPPWPENVARIDRWLQRADALLGRRGDLRTRADDLAMRLQTVEDPDQRDEIDYQREVLERLITGLDALTATAPTIDNVAGLRARRTEAERVGQTSLTDAASAWQQAITAIADPATCPAYDGLRLPGPQVGLVPLGIDARSGLWEFWHVESGDRPVVERDGAGRITKLGITVDSGMVFVLAPPGSFVMGALTVGDEHSGEAPIDPSAAPMERFVHKLHLDAFFVSKFECTQGQWLRLAGTRPSFTTRATSRGDVDLRHPVEQITWHDATLHLARRRLRLPTEAQWEYFARGGTKTIWSNGDDVGEMSTYANICDESSGGINGTPVEPGLDDGYPHTAPVGTFAPNAFGLHDVHGNVSEWCRDWLVSYVRPVATGECLREPTAEDDPPTLRMHRGGDFAERAHLSRVASRNALAPYRKTARVGIRPIRTILR
ncbi:MAG: bifunctional serine/threonine-protein kinase/formylglycine-generating enzyme family protein [bacterium]|nr:bifunctional serine/threonine-protein kinase/formylglycine-generating enzyme family protein [bacterium]